MRNTRDIQPACASASFLSPPSQPPAVRQRLLRFEINSRQNSNALRPAWRPASFRTGHGGQRAAAVQSPIRCTARFGVCRGASPPMTARAASHADREHGGLRHSLNRPVFRRAALASTEASKAAAQERPTRATEASTIARSSSPANAPMIHPARSRAARQPAAVPAVSRR